MHHLTHVCLSYSLSHLCVLVCVCVCDTLSQALDEIHAGSCDGLTYEKISERFPDEYEARRQDKLRYRCGACISDTQTGASVSRYVHRTS